MPSRREQIKMTDAEVLSFLGEEKTVICATNGVSGWPHLMPLWFVVRPTGPDEASELWAWTFAKSQKTKNLERDARASLQVEAGLEYQELRGVMLEANVVIHREIDAVEGLGSVRETFADAVQSQERAHAPSFDKVAMRADAWITISTPPSSGRAKRRAGIQGCQALLDSHCAVGRAYARRRGNDGGAWPYFFSPMPVFLFTKASV